MAKKLSLKKDGAAIQSSEFVNSIQKEMKTPVVKLKFCYLCKPFFYAGSYIPRYSITLIFDKKMEEERIFLEALEKLAVENHVDTLGCFSDGLISIKFQGKNQPELFAVESGKKEEEPIDLEQDLPEGFKACVLFEINTYFNKKTKKNGFNLAPKKVIFHLDEETQSKLEDGSDSNQSSGDRSRSSNNRMGNSKLRQGKERSVGKSLRATSNAPKIKRNRGATMDDKKPQGNS